MMKMDDDNDDGDGGRGDKVEGELAFTKNKIEDGADVLTLAYMVC